MKILLYMLVLVLRLFYIHGPTLWRCMKLGWSQQSLQINVFYTYCVSLTFQRRQLDFRPIYRQRRRRFSGLISQLSQECLYNSCLLPSSSRFTVHTESFFFFSFYIIKPLQLTQHVTLLRSHASRNMTSTAVFGQTHGTCIVAMGYCWIKQRFMKSVMCS